MSIESRRPGATCRAERGAFTPRVDATRCETKAECVEVCPYGVFEIRRIGKRELAELPLLARLQSIAHGRKLAAAPGADRCRACGLCVAACPERAIELVERPRAPA